MIYVTKVTCTATQIWYIVKPEKKWRTKFGLKYSWFKERQWSRKNEDCCDDSGLSGNFENRQGVISTELNWHRLNNCELEVVAPMSHLQFVQNNYIPNLWQNALSIPWSYHQLDHFPNTLIAMHQSVNQSVAHFSPAAFWQVVKHVLLLPCGDLNDARECGRCLTEARQQTVYLFADQTWLATKTGSSQNPSNRRRIIIYGEVCVRRSVFPCAFLFCGAIAPVECDCVCCCW